MGNRFGCLGLPGVTLVNSFEVAPYAVSLVKSREATPSLTVFFNMWLPKFSALLDLTCKSIRIITGSKSEICFQFRARNGRDGQCPSYWMHHYQPLQAVMVVKNACQLYFFKAPYKKGHFCWFLFVVKLQFIKWIEKNVDIKARENSVAYEANPTTFSQSFVFSFWFTLRFSPWQAAADVRNLLQFLCNETVFSVASQVRWEAWLQRRIRSLKQSASHVSRTWENGNTTDTFSKPICFVNIFYEELNVTRKG